MGCVTKSSAAESPRMRIALQGLNQHSFFQVPNAAESMTKTDQTSHSITNLKQIVAEYCKRNRKPYDCVDQSGGHG